MVSVLFSTLIGGMALGQAAPNIKYFQNGRTAGARLFRVIHRCLPKFSPILRQLPACACFIATQHIQGTAASCCQPPPSEHASLG